MTKGQLYLNADKIDLLSIKLNTPLLKENLMARSIAGPVIAGLGVGIAVVMLFSLNFKTAKTLSDAELIERTHELKEVKYFLEKYPAAKVTAEKLERGFEVTYSAEKQENIAGQNAVSEKKLIASVDPFGRYGAAVRIQCLHAAGMTIDVFHPTVKDIDGVCF